MAVTTLAVAAAAVLLQEAAVRGQSAPFEVTQSAGYSTEQVAAAATQAKAFGDAWAGIRFTAEAAWAARSEATSDAFGAQLQLVRQPPELPPHRSTALDGAITYSIRHD